MKDEIVQRWQCQKCGGTYNSYVSVLVVTCRRRHQPENMKLIEGEPAKHTPRTGRRDVRIPEPPEPRVKAGKISTVEELSKLFKTIG